MGGTECRGRFVEQQALTVCASSIASQVRWRSNGYCSLTVICHAYLTGAVLLPPLSKETWAVRHCLRPFLRNSALRLFEVIELIIYLPPNAEASNLTERSAAE